MDDANVILLSAGIQYDLVYSGTFSLLNKHDTVSVFLNKVNNWHIFMTFVNNPLKNIGAVDSIVGKNNLINLTHYNWYSDDWIEYSNPYIVRSTNGDTEIQIKVRSKANHLQPYRTVELTVWKKIQK